MGPFDFFTPPSTSATAPTPLPNYPQREIASELGMSLSELNAANQKMGDVEFEMDVARHIGPLGAFGPTDIGVINADYATADPKYQIFDTSKPNIKGMLQGRYFPKTGRVHAYGPSNWTPQLWAHEYRHKMAPELSEASNRLVDYYTRGELPEDSAAYEYLSSFETPRNLEFNLENVYNVFKELLGGRGTPQKLNQITQEFEESQGKLFDRRVQQDIQESLRASD